MSEATAAPVQKTMSVAAIARVVQMVRDVAMMRVVMIPNTANAVTEATAVPVQKTMSVAAIARAVQMTKSAAMMVRVLDHVNLLKDKIVVRQQVPSFVNQPA